MTERLREPSSSSIDRKGLSKLRRLSLSKSLKASPLSEKQEEKEKKPNQLRKTGREKKDHTPAPTDSPSSGPSRRVAPIAHTSSSPNTSITATQSPQIRAVAGSSKFTKSLERPKDTDPSAHWKPCTGFATG
jgi:hypothetical protein